MTEDPHRREYNIRKVVEAAGRVIGRHGFEGATIDRVAEEAHVAKGTIYRYFSHKEDLLLVVVIDGVRAMINETGRRDRRDLPPLERLRAFVENQFRIQIGYQDLRRAFFLEGKFFTPEGGDARKELLQSLFSTHVDFVASILKSAVDAGDFRPIDPHFAAFSLTEMIRGCLRRRLLGIVKSRVEEDADAVLDLFLKGVMTVPYSQIP